MPILLSVIIPHYNSGGTLSETLASVVAQNVKDLEVIVVDDCSTESCEEVIEEYRRRGLTINFIKSRKRIYTKNARLIGIEAARGEIVTFIDADDWFYGENTLPGLIEIKRQKKVEILQFNMYDKDEGTGALCRNKFALPYSQDAVLYGLDGFDFYCRNKFDGHSIWGKLYSRELLTRCLPIAKEIEVHRYCEDLFLYTIFAFHAKSFVGVDITGYLYRKHQDEGLHTARKNLGRVVTANQMERYLLPYLERQGCSEATLKILRDWLIDLQQTRTIHYCSYMQSLTERDVDPQELAALLSVMPAETYLKVLLINAPAAACGSPSESQKIITELKAKYNHLLNRTAVYRKFIKFCKSPLRYFKDAWRKH